MSAARMTERTLLDLLHVRYTKVDRYSKVDRYIRAEHVRMPDQCAFASAAPDDPRFAYGRAKSIADFIAIDTHGAGAIIGHEVKVTRSDWLAELRKPEKSEAWRRHCTTWWLVVPDKHIVRDDLPEGWGLMSLAGGSLRAVARPTDTRHAEPLTPLAMALLGRAILKTSERRVKRGALPDSIT